MAGGRGRWVKFILIVCGAAVLVSMVRLQPILMRQGEKGESAGEVSTVKNTKILGGSRDIVRLDLSNETQPLASEMSPSVSAMSPITLVAQPSENAVPGPVGPAVKRFFEGDPTPPGCPKRYFTFINNFGQMNNQLISLLHGFEISRAMNYTFVLTPFLEPSRHYRATRYFNFSLFTEAGYCFIDDYSPHLGPIRKHAAYRIFRVLPANVSRPYHLLRPTQLIADEVESVLRMLPARFTGVHRRVGLSDLYWCNATEADRKPPYCLMNPPYIHAMQEKYALPTADPIFLATDEPRIKVSIPVVRYRGRHLHNHMAAIFIDFWVLTKATLMLGNPCSSVAMNVCNWRRANIAELRNDPCAGLQFCWDRPPYIAGWPCGSPVMGIGTEL